MSMAVDFHGNFQNFVRKDSPQYRASNKAFDYNQVRVVDPELGSMAVNYIRDAGFLHENGGCTPVPTLTRAGSYGKYDPKTYVQDRAEGLAPRTVAAEGDLVRTKASYSVNPKAYSIPLSDLIDAEASSQALIMTSISQKIGEVCARTREIEYAKLLFDRQTGAWGGQVAGDAAATPAATFNPYSGTANLRKIVKWSTHATATPVRDLMAMGRIMKANTLFYPNTLVLGSRVPEEVVQADDLLGRVNRGQTDGTARGALNQLSMLVNEMWGTSDFRIYTMGEVEDIGKFINQNDAWLGFVSRTPTLTQPTAIANFYWTGWNGSPMTTFDSYYDQSTLSTMYRGVYANQFLPVADASGMVIKGLV